MPKTFNLEYKCRRCGAVVVDSSGPCGAPAFNTILGTVVWGGQKPATPGLDFHMTDMHTCNDGGWGVTDFIGTDRNPLNGDKNERTKRWTTKAMRKE